MGQLQSAKLILNPAAGRGRAGRVLPEVMRLLEDGGLPVTLAVPKDPSASRAEAEEAVRRGCDLLICMGGDGLIRDVLPACIGSGVPLGIIPAGTGNDLVRTLGIGCNPLKAVEMIVKGSVRTVDACRLGDSYFVNIASAGLDAAVAEEMNRRKYASGTAAYVLSLLRVLPSFRPAEFQLEFDDQRIVTRAMLVALANARCYGGGMMIAPEASLCDGLMDIVIVEQMSKLELLKCFPKVYKGGHISHPRVRFFRTNKVTMTSDSPQPVMADGDVVAETPVEIEVLPGALRVIA